MRFAFKLFHFNLQRIIPPSQLDIYQKIKKRFPYLSDDKLQYLLGFTEMVMLNEGEAFTKAGEWSQRGAIVIEGIVRNYILNDNGEEVTVVFATEMQMIAPYSTVFLNRPASETTEAVEASVLMVMDFKKFKELMEGDHTYARLYIDVLEAILVATIERVEDFTKKKPEQRYRRLLEIHGHLIERVPLKYLASYLGITAVSLSRIRKRLMPKRN